jgi:hypothetical protein
VARFNKILSTFKTKKIRWIEYMTLSEEMTKAYRVLAGKPEVSRPLSAAP